VLRLMAVAGFASLLHRIIDYFIAELSRADGAVVARVFLCI
jgi:hypothetical protein